MVHGVCMERNAVVQYRGADQHITAQLLSPTQSIHAPAPWTAAGILPTVVASDRPGRDGNGAAPVGTQACFGNHIGIFRRYFFHLIPFLP